MARRYYGLDRGETSVTESSSTTSKDVEVSVDLAVSLAKSEAYNLIDYIADFFLRGNWPPASSLAGMIRVGANRGQIRADVRSDLPDFATGTVTAASVLAGDTVSIDGQTLTAQDLRESSTVVCGADTAGSLNDKYFKFYVLVGGAIVPYALRISVNAAGGFAPVAGCTTLHVNVATGATGATIATAIKTCLDANTTGLTTSRSTATLTLLNDATGAVTDIADGNTGWTISTGRQGADSPGTGKFSMNGTDTAVATSIAAACAASSAAVSAAAVAAVCTFTANAGGTAGNAITLTSSNGTRLAVSGSGTLASGAAASLSNDDVYADIDTTASLSTMNLISAFEIIKGHLVKGNWPPA